MAAGLGSRLKDLTAERPKALVEYRGKALIAHVIEKLISYGYREIVVNVHHFPGMISEWIHSSTYNADFIISEESDELLDTGGGLKEAAKYFNTWPVLVHNVDILSTLDLNSLEIFHQKNHAMTTLAVKERETSRSLLVNNWNILCGWRNNNTGEEIITRKEFNTRSLAFSAVYMIEKEFIHNMPDEKVFPVMPYILELSRTKDILVFEHSWDEWTDMGKREEFGE